jgi:hypothetical protein
LFRQPDLKKQQLSLFYLFLEELSGRRNDPMDLTDKLKLLIDYNQLSTMENNRQKTSKVKKYKGQNEVEKQSVSPVADLQTGRRKADGWTDSWAGDRLIENINK